jgi:Gram-negative porin
MRNLLLGAAALLAAMTAAPGAWATTGHADVSYARSEDGADVDTVGLGGVVAFDANEVGVQLDFDYANSSVDDVDDDADIWSIGGHVYKQTNEWLIGGYAGYSRLSPDNGDDLDAWQIAAEGQYYLKRTTLGAAVSYGESDDIDTNTWGVEGDVKHFYTDNFSVGANLGLGNTESNDEDSDFWTAGVGAEYQLASTPISFFGGWQHTDSDDDEEADSFGVGARWNFGGTLFDRNRSGGDLKRRLGAPTAFGAI